MKSYPKPTTDRQEVLLAAIKTGYVDCLKFSWMEGFRTRVSDLRKVGIKFTPERITRKGRRGRPMTFIRHKLATQAARDMALGVYLKMVKKAA